MENFEIIVSRHERARNKASIFQEERIYPWGFPSAPGAEEPLCLFTDGEAQELELED